MSDLITETIDKIARAEQKRIERAIRGAIRAGYDGVDINQYTGTGLMGVESIVPWDSPAPDIDNGYRTERYTWDWFSDDELTEILRAENPMEVLQEADDA